MSAVDQPLQLSFLEKADLLPAILQVGSFVKHQKLAECLTDVLTVGAALYAAITGPFRGDWGNKKYRYHVGHAAFRKMEERLSPAQAQ
jgi:hypothetical protein